MYRAELADLAAFVAVAEQRSFRAAAGRLGVTPSALSHTMRQLEDRLAIRLLNRTTRSVALTDAGARLLERLRPAMDQIGEALGSLDQERRRPFGRLRIYAVHTAALAIIVPVWRRFLANCPDVQLEVHVGEAPIDIVASGFDAGIGPADRASADMTMVQVMGPARIAVVGAPGYLARRSRPRSPDDLRRHQCVQYRRGADLDVLGWRFERCGEVRLVQPEGQIMVNHPDLAVRAAVDGLGLTYTLEAQVELLLQAGLLLRVLEEWSPSINGMFLYYPGRQQVPAALRAFSEMIRNSHAPGVVRPIAAAPDQRAS